MTQFPNLYAEPEHHLHFPSLDVRCTSAETKTLRILEKEKIKEIIPLLLFDVSITIHARGFQSFLTALDTSDVRPVRWSI